MECTRLFKYVDVVPNIIRTFELHESGKNDNMVCVIVDVIILIIIDVPDLPYPFNIILFGSDIGYISYKLWNHGNGAKLYHISKTVIVLLLGI